MKTTLLPEEIHELKCVGVILKDYSLGNLLDELEIWLDGYHWQLEHYYNGWEVGGDLGLTYKRCPDLINAVAGTIYIYAKDKNR